MKYVIDIEDKPIEGLYKAKEFNTLVFDANGLSKLEKYQDNTGILFELKALAINSLRDLYAETGANNCSIKDKKLIDINVKYHKLVAKLLAYDV